MKDFTAQVRVLVNVPFQADVDELDLEERGRVQVAVNEETVLAQRADAGRLAEQIAAETFKGFDVVELHVESVSE